MSFDTTTPEIIRAALGAQIMTILPRHEPARDQHWTYQPDQEIAGTLRNFDLIFEVEQDVPGGAYSGGVELVCPVEIRVAYPVSEPARRRFMGADLQDLAMTLVRFSPAGMFPIGVRGDAPIIEVDHEGTEGAFVGRFHTRIHFFADDTVGAVA